jgi:hypothetical protein
MLLRLSKPDARRRVAKVVNFFLRRSWPGGRDGLLDALAILGVRALCDFRRG